MTTPQASADTVHAAAGAGLRPGWLQRLPPGLFGIPLGVLGLGSAWARLGRVDGDVAAVAAGVAGSLAALGTGLWALLEVRILHRLFAGPLPLPLRATLGIEMAPASVGALMLSLLWPQLPADVLLVALGIGTGPMLAVMSRWSWWREAPFAPGFWSFSFPIAAYASDIVEAVHRGGWPAAPAWVAVAVASAVIGYLALRTLALWRDGRLLPPA